MKIYLVTWPIRKDPGGALALFKTEQKKILLSYLYLLQENEGVEGWHEDIPCVSWNRERCL